MCLEIAFLLPFPSNVIQSLDQSNLFKSCHRRCFVKKGEASNFINKETLAQVFSCEFEQTNLNTFFYRTSLDSCFCLFCLLLSLLLHLNTLRTKYLTRQEHVKRDRKKSIFEHESYSSIEFSFTLG